MGNIIKASKPYPFKQKIVKQNFPKFREFAMI